MQGFSVEQGPLIDQIAHSAQEASDQFAGLSGADLGRAFVFNEKARAYQLLDLIDNQFFERAFRSASR